MSSNNLDITSVQKSLVLCVCAAKVQMSIFNAAEAVLLVAISAFICSVMLYSKMSSRDYLKTRSIWKLVRYPQKRNGL